MIHRGFCILNLSAYEDVDSMFVALQAGSVDGVMLDRFKAYYYLNELKDDKLRVAQLLDIPLNYGAAVVDRRSNVLTMKNGCIVNYFVSKHKVLDRLIKKYISPVKVRCECGYMPPFPNHMLDT